MREEVGLSTTYTYLCAGAFVCLYMLYVNVCVYFHALRLGLGSGVRLRYLLDKDGYNNSLFRLQFPSFFWHATPEENPIKSHCKCCDILNKAEVRITFAVNTTKRDLLAVSIWWSCSCSRQSIGDSTIAQPMWAISDAHTDSCKVHVQKKDIRRTEGLIQVKERLNGICMKVKSGDFQNQEPQFTLTLNVLKALYGLCFA